MASPSLVSHQPCAVCLETVSVLNPEFQWDMKSALNLVTSGKRGRGTLPDLVWPFHFRAWYNFYSDSCNIKLTFHGLLLFLFVFLLAFHIPLSSVEGKRTIFFGVIISINLSTPNFCCLLFFSASLTHSSFLLQLLCDTDCWGSLFSPCQLPDLFTLPGFFRVSTFFPQAGFPWGSDRDQPSWQQLSCGPSLCSSKCVNLSL